jgi:hypothetical protein
MRAGHTTKSYRNCIGTHARTPRECDMHGNNTCLRACMFHKTIPCRQLRPNVARTTVARRHHQRIYPDMSALAISCFQAPWLGRLIE